MATPDQATGVSDADITGTVIEAIDSFDAMGLSEPLLRGIYAYGFEKPSAMSKQTTGVSFALLTPSSKLQLRTCSCVMD